jgi:hypothetical protein
MANYIRAFGRILANEWNPEVVSRLFDGLLIADPSTCRSWFRKIAILASATNKRQAMLGLDPDDPSAIPYLEAAHVNRLENCEGFRTALDQLRATLSESTE